ncbi:hypothetical protein HMPREF9406_3473 [Clostridium sp. HGF2]|nr:hypothetical protein HMPREF9406_3473 [Clostridium sp. HGF2]EQJ56525.1 hypothetical protein QSI_2264 [Clostridioides difficile P28]
MTSYDIHIPVSAASYGVVPASLIEKFLSYAESLQLCHVFHVRSAVS